MKVRESGDSGPVPRALDRIAGRTIGRQVLDRQAVERRRFFFGGLLAFVWLLIW